MEGIVAWLLWSIVCIVFGSLFERWGGWKWVGEVVQSVWRKNPPKK
jgi:hypothetical protein